MAKKTAKLGEIALSALSINDETEKLKALMKAKKDALKKKNHAVKEQFNTARVAATMSVASTVFSALGVDIYTSVQAACKVPSNVVKLNESGSFDVLFEDEKKILAAIADFLRNRPDVQGEIFDFVDKYRADMNMPPRIVHSSEPVDKADNNEVKADADRKE